MKKIFYVMFAGVAAIMLSSCEDETETKVLNVPSFTLAQSSVTLTAAGTDLYTISYSVSNPADEGSVTASADAAWITDLDASSISGQLRFAVSANTSHDLRTGTISLTYSYDEGSVTAKAAVVQYGEGDTTLSIDPKAVMAEYQGGTYSFGYSIENDIYGEELNCTADTDWITSFDYSTYGVVSFEVAYSGEKEARTATITVTYAGLEGEVTVVQDHLAGVGGFKGDIDDLVGTYKAAGYAYSDSGPVYDEWTLTIYKNGTNGMIIDGLTPICEGMYPESEGYIAKASLNSHGQIIIPTQYNGVDYLTYYHVGWTPCVGYEEGVGWYYDQYAPDCTLVYDTATEVWTSDYGVFFCPFMPGYDYELVTFFDVTAPEFTITKISDETGASPASLKSLDELTPLNGAKLAE